MNTPTAPQPFTPENPRFVWNIGSLPEEFPDLPGQGDCVELIDRLTGKPVATLAKEWGQLFCLEHKAHGTPLTDLETWINSLTKETLDSENLPTP
jgi:hypothetical protein